MEILGKVYCGGNLPGRPEDLFYAGGHALMLSTRLAPTSAPGQKTDG